MIKSILNFFSFLNPFVNWIERIKPYNLFVNYFWLTTVTAILNLTTGIGWLLTLVLPLVIYSILIKTRLNDAFNIFDVLWFVSLIWIAFTWIDNDYPHKGILVFRCICSQVAYMCVYWIARCSSNNVIDTIIQNSIKPLVITALIGVYCFFFHPLWYQNIIARALENSDLRETEFLVAEYNRLRSIFNSPYTISYFSGIVLIREFFIMIKGSYDKTDAKFHYGLIVVLIIVMILAMMRAPLACVFFSFVISIIYSLRYLKLLKLIKQVLVVSIVGGIVLGASLNKMDDLSLSHLLSKYESVTSTGEELTKERFYLMDANMSMTGNGAGRYANYASKYPPNYALPDGEYMKAIGEQGYIGLGIWLVLFGLAVIKAIHNFKYLAFELCLILMLLFCMIGASPLTTIDKHPIIFWLALGQIAAFKKNNVIRI